MKMGLIQCLAPFQGEGNLDAETHRGMPSAKEVEDGLMHLHTEERQGSLAPGDQGSR